MPILLVAPGSVAANVAFAAGTYTTPSITFSAGDYLLYVNNNNATASTAVMATAILNGVSGTKVNQPNASVTSHTLWRFLGVGSGTGAINITCTAGAFGTVALAWVGLTGVNWTGATYTNDVAGSHADPQTVTGTVPTGAGIGVCFIS